MKRNLPGNDRHDAYFEAVKAADRSVDAQISAIRRREDEGDISPVESAEERIVILEAHLRELDRLRQEHLGGS